VSVLASQWEMVLASALASRWETAFELVLGIPWATVLAYALDSPPERGTQTESRACNLQIAGILRRNSKTAIQAAASLL